MADAATPSYESLIAKLDAVKINLDRAARLKRRYEYTIGFLAATVVTLLVERFT